MTSPAASADHARLWLGNDDPAVTCRLVPFAQVGADGTYTGFWFDDSGRQRMVILGSGSGSVLACHLRDDPVDLLRLVAIGYEELGWHRQWTDPPRARGVTDSWSGLNEPYREWLTTTFGVTIPETASELVPRPVEMGAQGTDDDFANWCNVVAG